MKKKCPTCGEGALSDGTTDETVTVGPRSFVVTVPARVCDRCGEAIVSTATMAALEATVARELVAVGASDGAALRWLRKSAHITGADLARLLDVAPETVSRWENGVQSPDRATVALLGALCLDALDGRTQTREHLVTLASERAPQGEPVRVKLRASSVAA